MNEQNFAAIVLVGGKGILEYRKNVLLQRISQQFYKSGKIVAAICFAPIILAETGLLKTADAACHPECKNELISLGIHYRDTNIVIENNIVTANGPHSAVQFAETILNKIV